MVSLAAFEALSATCRAFLVLSMCTTTVPTFLLLAGFWRFVSLHPERFGLTSTSSVVVTAQAASLDHVEFKKNSARGQLGEHFLK